MSFDVIVVGAGAAGLAATKSPAHRPMAPACCCWNVPTEPIPISPRAAGSASVPGSRLQAAAGVPDTPAIWTQDIARKTGGDIDELVVYTVTTRSKDAIHFLQDAGIPIHLMQGIPIVGHQLPRQHATPSENGREFATLMTAAAARQAGVTRHDSAEVTGLIVDQGGVTGVEAIVGGRRQAFRAPTTVLACGGFAAANQAMLRQYVPEVVSARHIGCPGNRGCGIVWAKDLGAATGFMDSHQGHGHVTVKGHGRPRVRPDLARRDPHRPGRPSLRQGRHRTVRTGGPCAGDARRHRRRS